MLITQYLKAEKYLNCIIYSIYVQIKILHHYEGNVPLRGSNLRGASPRVVIAKA